MTQIEKICDAFEKIIEGRSRDNWYKCSEYDTVYKTNDNRIVYKLCGTPLFQLVDGQMWFNPKGWTTQLTKRRVTRLSEWFCEKELAKTSIGYKCVGKGKYAYLRHSDGSELEMHDWSKI